MRLNVLIFEWLNGEHALCLISFISPSAFSRLAVAPRAEREEKNRTMLSAKKKKERKKEQNIREHLVVLKDGVDSQYRIAYEYAEKNCFMMK